MLQLTCELQATLFNNKNLPILLTIGTIKNVKKKNHQEWIQAINKIMPKNPSKKSKIILLLGTF